jgi:hypothetical protein
LLPILQTANLNWLEQVGNFAKDFAQNYNYRAPVCASGMILLLFLILIYKSTLVWILFFPIIMAGILQLYYHPAPLKKCASFCVGIQSK